MPPTATESATEVLVCWQSFSSPHGVTARGERLRADHPQVVDYGGFFCADGIPEGSWPDVLDAAHANNTPEREQERFRADAAAHRVKLEPPRLFRLRADLVCVLEERATTLVGGSVVTGDHVLVAEHPAAFTEVKFK